MSVEAAMFLTPGEKAALAGGGYVSLEQVAVALPSDLARILPLHGISAPPSSTDEVQASSPISHHHHTHASLLSANQSTRPAAHVFGVGAARVTPTHIENALRVADRCLATLQLQSQFLHHKNPNNLASKLMGGALSADESETIVPSNNGWLAQHLDGDVDCTPLALAEEIDQTIPTTHLPSQKSSSPSPVGEANAEEPSWASRQKEALHRLSAANEWILQASAEAHLPPPPTVVSLSQLLIDEQHASLSKIATFARDFDTMLGGGVPLGCVTEMCGSPGMGKTQMGMQMAVSVQLPPSFGGLGGRCLYLDTEGSFIPSRFREIACGAVTQVQKIANLQRHHQYNDGGSGALTAGDRQIIDAFSVSNILDRTSYVRVLQLSDLIAIINGLPSLLEDPTSKLNNINNNISEGALPTTPIKLVVIDSIAFHFRYALGTDYTARARLAHSLGQILQQHARALNIAIVVTNQMNPAGAVFGEGAPDRPSSGWDDTQSGPAPLFPNVLGLSNLGDRLVPALGDSWAQGITTRVLIRCLSEAERRHVVSTLTNRHADSLAAAPISGGSSVTQRQHLVETLQRQVSELRVAMLVKNSSQSRAQCYFRITERGIRNPSPELLDALSFGASGKKVPQQ